MTYDQHRRQHALQVTWGTLLDAFRASFLPRDGATSPQRIIRMPDGSPVPPDVLEEVTQRLAVLAAPPDPDNTEDDE